MAGFFSAFRACQFNLYFAGSCLWRRLLIRTRAAVTRRVRGEWGRQLALRRRRRSVVHRPGGRFPGRGPRSTRTFAASAVGTRRALRSEAAAQRVPLASQCLQFCCCCCCVTTFSQVLAIRKSDRNWIESTRMMLLVKSHLTNFKLQLENFLLHFFHAVPKNSTKCRKTSWYWHYVDLC